MTNGELFKKENVNLNTVLGIISFLVVFSSIIVTFASVKFQQNQTNEWQDKHETLHKQMAVDRASTIATYTTRLDAMQEDLSQFAQYEYRIAQNEKAIESNDTRLNRMSESYGNQFAELRVQMNQLAIQLALANDALKRIERIKEDKVP